MQDLNRHTAKNAGLKNFDLEKKLNFPILSLDFL